MTWTVERVKEELLKVRLKIGKTEVMANVSGRKNDFATVWYRDQSWEFAWATVTRCLNLDRPLIA